MMYIFTMVTLIVIPAKIQLQSGSERASALAPLFLSGRNGRAMQPYRQDLEEAMGCPRHRNVKTLMVYRDRERNVKGCIAALAAAGA